jgi:hypothetical protein
MTRTMFTEPPLGLPLVRGLLDGLLPVLVFVLVRANLQCPCTYTHVCAYDGSEMYAFFYPTLVAVSFPVEEGNRVHSCIACFDG